MILWSCHIDILLFYYRDVLDYNFSGRTISIVHRNSPDPLNDIKSGINSAKNRMFSIQPRSRPKRNKKLRSISIWTRVCHRQDARTSMFEFSRDFVFKFFSTSKKGMLPVNRRSSSPCSSRISALYHKIFDDSVKSCLVIVPRFSQLNKIFTSFWSLDHIQFQHKFAQRSLKFQLCRHKLKIYFLLKSWNFEFLRKMNNERYCFEAEWFDNHAELFRQYQLFYYPFDSSVEMVFENP